MTASINTITNDSNINDINADYNKNLHDSAAKSVTNNTNDNSLYQALNNVTNVDNEIANAQHALYEKITNNDSGSNQSNHESIQHNNNNDNTASHYNTINDKTESTSSSDSDIGDIESSDDDKLIINNKQQRRHCNISNNNHNNEANDLINNILQQEQIGEYNAYKLQSNNEYNAAIASTLLPYEMLPIEQQYMSHYFNNYQQFYIDIRNSILCVWHSNINQYVTFDYCIRKSRIAKRYIQAAQQIYEFLDSFGYINTGLLKPQHKPIDIRNIHSRHDTIQRRHIIIIGAGVSGLAAARQLLSFGHTVTVIEARDRIGGRVYTDTETFGGNVDMGASIVVGLQGMDC